MVRHIRKGKTKMEIKKTFEIKGQKLEMLFRLENNFNFFKIDERSHDLGEIMRRTIETIKNETDSRFYCYGQAVTLNGVEYHDFEVIISHSPTAPNGIRCHTKARRVGGDIWSTFTDSARQQVKDILEPQFLAFASEHLEEARAEMMKDYLSSAEKKLNEAREAFGKVQAIIDQEGKQESLAGQPVPALSAMLNFGG